MREGRTCCCDVETLFFFTCLFVGSSSLLVRSASSGLWSSGATWHRGVVPGPADDVLIEAHNCSGSTLAGQAVTLDSVVSVASVSFLSNKGVCVASLVLTATGRLVAASFVASIGTYVFLDGGSLKATSILLHAATLGGAGYVNGTTVAIDSLIVPGVSGLFMGSNSCCWPGYPQASRYGDLVFSDLAVSDSTALISGAQASYSPRVPATATVSSIYATRLTVSVNSSLFVNMQVNGPFLRWETLLLYGSIVAKSGFQGLSRLLDCSCSMSNITNDPVSESPPGSAFCPTTLGTLTFITDHCETLCSCLPEETCLDSFLCQRPVPAGFIGLDPAGNSTTSPVSGGGGVETWVILVAVLVPVAVLAGVGAVLLMRYLHGRSMASRTDTMNRNIRAKEMDRM